MKSKREWMSSFSGTDGFVQTLDDSDDKNGMDDSLREGWIPSESGMNRMIRVANEFPLGTDGTVRFWMIAYGKDETFRFWMSA